MPRIRVLGRDDVARTVRVKPENMHRYAPVQVRSATTGRLRTAYVKSDDTIIVDESSLTADALDALDLDPQFVELTVTAGSEYTAEKPGNDALFIDASFTVVVPADEVAAAQDAIESALRDTMQSSGLPADGIKIGFDVGGSTDKPPGVAAGSVRMGPRRNKMRSYGYAREAAAGAIQATLTGLEPRPSSRIGQEASRRLTARQDAAGRWRDTKGRYVKAPGTVVVR